MKRRYILIIVNILIAMFIIGCGGSNTKCTSKKNNHITASSNNSNEHNISPNNENNNTNQEDNNSSPPGSTNNNNPPNNSSNNENNNTSNNATNTNSNKSHIKGVSQKGTLLDGEVSFFKYNKGTIGDKIISTQINKNGEYKADINESGYFVAKANGFFFDEYLGTKSNHKAELYSLVKLENNISKTSNINIFTSLAYFRIKKLMKDGKSYNEALKKVKNELNKTVGLSQKIDAQQLNINNIEDNNLLKEENKNLLLFSATLLKVINAPNSNNKIMKKNQKIFMSSLSSMYKDFEDDGNFNSDFKPVYTQMKKENKENIWKRAVKNLAKNPDKIPILSSLHEWARDDLVPIDNNYDIPVDIIVNPIQITEFKFWGTKIDDKLFDYNNSNAKPSAMFLGTDNNSVILRFTISLKGSGTLNIYAKSLDNQDKLLISSSNETSSAYRSKIINIEVDNNLKEFFNSHDNVTFYASLGSVEKDILSIPILAGLSNEMNPNTNIQTASYKGDCPNPSYYPVEYISAFDAKMDIDGIFRNSTPISYRDVCVQLYYNPEIKRFYPNLKSGYYGELATPIYREIGDYNVTFYVENNRTDSNGITISNIEVKLPPEHSIHKDNNTTIDPRGSNILSLGENQRILSTELLPNSFNGNLSLVYLHGKDIPLYFKLNSYTLDSNGLKFQNTIPEYIFERNNRQINNAGRFQLPDSNPIDIWLKSTGIETLNHINFAKNTIFLPSFPAGLDVTRGEYSIDINQSEISVISNGVDTNIVVSYNKNCKGFNCNTLGMGSLTFDNNINNTQLLANGGSISSYIGEIGTLEWGNKDSNNAVFVRDKDENAKIYIWGYKLPTNKAEEVALFLQGTIDEHNSSYYKVNSNFTKEGKGLFAGVNIGSLEKDIDEKTSLANKGMNIKLGDKDINITTHEYSRYYIRLAGITGLFNDIKNENGYSPTSIYGYPITFKQIKFRTIKNNVDEFTKIDGLIELDGKANFDVNFTNLGMNCRGGLEGGKITTPKAIISAWHLPTTFTTLDFENMDNKECADKKLLTIGHIIKIASLKDKIGARITWNSNGTPEGNAKITKSSFNQLDGNVSKDKNISNDGYDVELETLRLASSSTQDWIESNMSIGLPFWGAKDMSARMENSDGNYSIRKKTIITDKGKLFSDNRNNNDNTSTLMDKIKDSKYQFFVSKKWAGILNFELPIYYDSKEDSVPSFLGRKLKGEDLIVMKTNAGINYITPNKTAMSFGASADFEKLRELNLHVDLNNPESLKEIDKTLYKYLNIKTSLYDIFGRAIEYINIGNRLLKDGLTLSMEKTAFFALKEVGEAHPNSDPFEQLAELNAQVYAIPIMLREHFNSIVEELNSGNIKEAENEYRELLENLNRTRDIVHLLANRANFDPNELSAFLKREAFGSDSVCSWENFTTKGFFKPIGSAIESVNEVNKEIQDFDISKIEKFAKAINKYGINGDKLVSIAKKIKVYADDLNDYISGQNRWIENSFSSNGLICGNMDEIDNKLISLHNELTPFIEVAGKIDSNLSEINELVQNNNLIDIKNDVIHKIDSLIELAQNSIPNLSSDDMRRLAIAELFESDAVYNLVKGIDEQLTPIKEELNKISLTIFSPLDKSINQVLAKANSEINNILSKATSALDNIPLSSAYIDGYSIFYGDQLAQLHIGSDFKIKGKDEESSFSFKASLDVKNNEINGTYGCSGENGTGNLEATISTRDISMPIGDKKLKVDLILLGVNIENTPKVNGIFGGIESKDGFLYNKFKLYNLGLATGIGENETYLGAKANAKMDDVQLGVSFLVGVVCNKDMIEMILPKPIYKFITLPNNKFNGAMVFGEAQIPIWKNGCLLTVNARAKLGTWFLFGPPKTFGGIVGGGAFGKGLCIATLGGEVEILAQKSGDDVKFEGSGWGAAGVGLCDNSWSSISDSRSDSWCGTGDAKFGAIYHNGWELKNIKTSAVH